jgi:Trypsin-like peptidase domain
MSKAIFDSIKKATVAIVAPLKAEAGKRPFRIFGSGFCIHPNGIVVTCEHVFRPFVDPDFYRQIVQAAKDADSPRIEGDALIPHSLFFYGVAPPEVRMVPVPVENVVTKTDYDLAALKLRPHAAFPNGFPTLPIARYEDVHEMMEIGTCGFPLGDGLQDQLGTVTSSFTKGVISSIIPAANVPKEHVKGFQLDITTTNGNSGGPVYSLATGEVFGVLQQGVLHPQGYIVQGIKKAEPVYPVLANDLIDRLMKGQM